MPFNGVYINLSLLKRCVKHIMCILLDTEREGMYCPEKPTPVYMRRRVQPLASQKLV